MLKFVKILVLAFLVSVSNFAYAKPTSKPAEDLPYTVLPRTDRMCFRASFHSGRRYADLIFTGRYIEQQNLGASILIFGRERQNTQFEIVESFKGDLKAGERFYIQVEDIYDYEFAPNEVYLVFAYNHYKDKYASLACPRIEPAFRYNDRMPYLRVPDDIERNKLLKKKLLAESKGEIFISKLDGPVYVKGGIVENQTLQNTGETKSVEELGITPATEVQGVPINQQPDANTKEPAKEPEAQQKLPDFITDDFVPLENLEGENKSNENKPENNTPNNNIPNGDTNSLPPLPNLQPNSNTNSQPKNENKANNNTKPENIPTNKPLDTKPKLPPKSEPAPTLNQDKNTPPATGNNQIPPELDILDLKPLDAPTPSSSSNKSTKPTEDNFDILPPDLN